MNIIKIDVFGNTFERISVALISILSGFFLIYLALLGPAFFGHIHYKTAEVMNNQVIGQDIINLFLLSPILIIGGIALILRKQIARFLLIITPLFLIYYVLSYTLGWEWSSAQYDGNSQNYTFYFLFILISALLILLYSLSIFPDRIDSNFRKRGLIIYSVLFTLFLLIFSTMWIKEVMEVISKGTSRGYDITPTAFWLVRIFDLGFTVPLGLISVYLLWTRPATTFPVQFMFYGFFLTMIIAVNAMGIMMLLKNDPTFLMSDLIVFICLALIVFFGFVYILRNYKVKFT